MKVVLVTIYFQSGIDEKYAVALEDCRICHIESDIKQIMKEHKSPKMGCLNFLRYI